MDRKKIAAELVKMAKDLVSGDRRAQSMMSVSECGGDDDLLTDALAGELRKIPDYMRGEIDFDTKGNIDFIGDLEVDGVSEPLEIFGRADVESLTDRELKLYVSMYGEDGRIGVRKKLKFGPNITMREIASEIERVWNAGVAKIVKDAKQ